MKIRALMLTIAAMVKSVVIAQDYQDYADGYEQDNLYQDYAMKQQGKGLAGGGG
jgi:deoxycytidylate deaminase